MEEPKPEHWNPVKKTITSRQYNKLLTNLYRTIVTQFRTNFSRKKQFTFKEVKNINPTIIITFMTQMPNSNNNVATLNAYNENVYISIDSSISSTVTSINAYNWLKEKLDFDVGRNLSALTNSIYSYLVNSNITKILANQYEKDFNDAKIWTIPALDNYNPEIKFINNYYVSERGTTNYRKVNAIVLSTPYNYQDTNEPVKAAFLYDYTYSEPVYNITLNDAYNWLVTFLNNY